MARCCRPPGARTCPSPDTPAGGAGATRPLTTGGQFRWLGRPHTGLTVVLDVAVDIVRHSGHDQQPDDDVKPMEDRAQFRELLLECVSECEADGRQRKCPWQRAEEREEEELAKGHA